MTKKNTARWVKPDGEGWQLLVEFQRHWEAPERGTGLGTTHSVLVVKRGKPPVREDVEWTSRVFHRDGKVLAFGEVS